MKNQRHIWKAGGLLALVLIACGGDGGGGGGKGGGGGGGAGGSGPPPPDCSAGCPDGYTCTGGVCTGGNPESLVFDIKTFPISGKLRVDGAAPQGNGCNEDQVRIEFLTGAAPEHFWESYTSDAIPILIDCDTSDGSFTGRVPPGTYRVTASRSGTYSSFPDATFVIDSKFTVTGPLTDLAWDLTTVPISGKIKVDGAAPVSACTYDQVAVSFVNAEGASHVLHVPCDASDGSFSGRVAPGTYRVLASAVDPYTSFPDATFLVDAAYQVTTAKSGVAWDLTTVPISGNIKVDGAAPVSACTYDQVAVSFVNAEGASHVLHVPCDASDGSFSGRVAPGTYRVLASAVDPYTSFPDATFLVDAAYQVTTAKSGVAWDLTTVPISGNIKVDGAAPVSACTYDQVAVSFVNAEGASHVLHVPCDASDGSFSGRVAPGTYRVLASAVDPYTSFPDATFLVDAAYQVTTAKSGIAWDLTTLQVAGKVLVDGVAPKGNGCNGEQVAVELLDFATLSAWFSLPVDCDATDGTFSGRVAPGTYRFLASQSSTYSTFPNATFKLQDALLIP